MPAGQGRTASRTVLMVGEGSDDTAFLRHLKSLYLTRGCGISGKPRNAHGKGPDNVVNYAIKQKRTAAYDRVVVLLDTDLEMSPTVRRKAKSNRILVTGSTPCLEGLLLKILGEHVPDTSKLCKEQLGFKLPGRLTRQEDYQSKFPKGLLDARRDDVHELGRLLGLLQFE